MSIAADYSSSREPIHFSTVFDGKTPVLCGKVGTPCPATNEWRYVGCEKCLALKTGETHARRSATAFSLCGLGPDGGPWTTQPSRVSCSACRASITRRTAPGE